jgi:hypothetical protein
MANSSSDADGSSSDFISDVEESGDEQEMKENENDVNSEDYQYFYRFPRVAGQPHLGRTIEGPYELDIILQKMLDNELDLDTFEFRQRRFCEWQRIDNPNLFPDQFVMEAERRHLENTSLRNIFLKYDVDGSATIDREEMTALMEALQFPTPLNEQEFHQIAGDDAEIDFLELHECKLFLKIISICIDL